MKIHTYASQPHYADHIEPIVAALPPELVGVRRAPRRCAWGEPGPVPTDGFVIVAGYSDAARCRRSRLIYVEHGAGQTYDGDPRSAGHAGFAGGDGLDHVALFICPSEQVCDRWRSRYPGTGTAAVGCPKLDRWHATPDCAPARPGLTVAITFHHEGGLVPETSWAMPHYRPYLGGVAAVLGGAEAVLVGHGHPRGRRSLQAMWARAGVEWVETAEEVFARADVLVADNTSLAFEFMSLGRPVVWLDAPWYRRDVEHGLRFWTHADSGVRISDPADLVGAIWLAAADHPEVRARREAAVRDVYAYTDGHAAERAAAAILAHLDV